MTRKQLIDSLNIIKTSKDNEIISLYANILRNEKFFKKNSIANSHLNFLIIYATSNLFLKFLNPNDVILSILEKYDAYYEHKNNCLRVVKSASYSRNLYYNWPWDQMIELIWPISSYSFLNLESPSS